jgi:hypothetical protein
MKKCSNNDGQTCGDCGDSAYIQLAVGPQSVIKYFDGHYVCDIDECTEKFDTKEVLKPHGELLVLNHLRTCYFADRIHANHGYVFAPVLLTLSITRSFIYVAYLKCLSLYLCFSFLGFLVFSFLWSCHTFSLY